MPRSECSVRLSHMPRDDGSIFSIARVVCPQRSWLFLAAIAKPRAKAAVFDCARWRHCYKLTLLLMVDVLTFVSGNSHFTPRSLRDRLLNDDYVFDQKVEIKTKTQNGMTFTSKAVKSADDSMAGDLSLKCAPFPGAVVTSKFFTNGKKTTETVVDRLGVDGLKLTLLAGQSSKANMLVSTVEYQHKSATFTAAADGIGSVAHLTGTVGSDSLTAGFSGEYDHGTKEVKNVDCGVHYCVDKDSEFSIVSAKKGAAAKISCATKTRGGWFLAGELMYEKASNSALAVMGGKYALDRDTTLKARLSSEGVLSASYIQNIRANTTLTLSQQVNVNSPETAPKFGLSLLIE